MNGHHSWILSQVGMVFQNGALFDSLSVGENVGFLLYEHTTLPPQRIQVCSMTSFVSLKRADMLTLNVTAMRLQCSSCASDSFILGQYRALASLHDLPDSMHCQVHECMPSM